MRRCLVVLIATAALAACSTTPTGRRQLQLFPDDQMATMGVQAFKSMRKEQPVSDDPALNRYASCVVKAVTGALPEKYAQNGAWEVAVFKEDSANAFALPGGKMGVNTGLFDVTENPSQLATVIGHEVAHVVSDHGNERMSQRFAVGAGMTAASVLASGESSGKRQLALAALGLGSQVGVLLPFSRLQESEADRVGLLFMARAGFDPRESVPLWENMKEASGGKAPPEFLSTHPASDNRIDTLQGDMPEAMEVYRQARANGHRPDCEAPGGGAG